MSSYTKLDIFLSIILTLIGIGILTLIIILFANRPKPFKEIKTDDITISTISSLNFIEIDSLPVYSESDLNLGLTGRLILDCYTGICQVEDYYYDSDDSLVEYYEDVLDYSCSQQCSYNENNECNCNIAKAKSKGKCSKKYDDQYEIGKYCYADNIIYNWKGKKYSALKKDILSYYNNAILKDEECPKGTINCGIIDDNENKLCIASSSNCPINYISENKTNPNKIYSNVIIGNKTFYYTFDDDNKNKRKIIAGLVADTDLYLNEDNDEKVIIDTDTISGFLSDNKNLYKQINLGFDPYKEDNIDNKGNSYLRIFYNKKVDLEELRDKINTYNLYHKINEDAINPVRKKTKLIMIFGLISYISFLFFMFLFFICGRFDDIQYGLIFPFIFFVFYIVSFIYVCINISKFNKLKNLDKNADNFPRLINTIIFGLYLGFFGYLIFLMIYVSYIRDKCRYCSCNICNKKNEVNNTATNIENIKEKTQNQNDKSVQGGQISSLNISGNN